jgi:hypothetical protein
MGCSDHMPRLKAFICKCCYTACMYGLPMAMVCTDVVHGMVRTSSVRSVTSLCWIPKKQRTMPESENTIEVK